MEMINNILIEVLSSIAEQERDKIRQRQREGIDCMPVKNGKKVSSNDWAALLAGLKQKAE